MTRLHCERRRDRGPNRAQECVDGFNRKFPVGTIVWFWRSLAFGPIEETAVRTEAFVSDCGAAVVFLFRVSGYVDICHITPVMERPRSDVRFAENRDVTR